MVKTFASILRLNITKQEVPLEIESPKYTSKNSLPAVIYNKDNFMIKLAEACRYIVIGKFSHIYVSLS